MTTGIHLMQFEDRELGPLATLLESQYSIVDADEFPGKATLSRKPDDEKSYWFVVKENSDGKVLLETLAYSGIKNIDWVSGTCDLVIAFSDWGMTSDLDKVRSVIGRILDFAFDEINIRKISCEVYQSNSLKLVLEQVGFVAEGVRKSEKFVNGRFIDTSVLSILKKEYKDS